MNSIQTSDKTTQSPKMLIADDDPSVVRLLAQRCADVGFEVEIATNGIQALLRANRSRPDILLIDINMPKADGFSVCEHLLDPTKIVVVTGSKDRETLERCKSLGAFYAHKGPDFWKNLTLALIEIFPGMEEKIKKLMTHPAAAKMRKRPRVLLVDDDPHMEGFFSNRLAKYGIELLYAADAAQGYKAACMEEPSVILCDYFMPNGDALYLLARLRTTRGTENTPVFILTGRRLEDAARQDLLREICGRPGAAKIFKKSFDTYELVGALEQFIGFQKKQTEEVSP